MIFTKMLAVFGLVLGLAACSPTTATEHDATTANDSTAVAIRTETDCGSLQTLFDAYNAGFDNTGQSEFVTYMKVTDERMIELGCYE